jgi:hypothetical protein
MQLPDFQDFAPFNLLREKMGATQLGFFELFDPSFHLTGDERSDLDRKGLEISLDRLHHLLDFTLVYKNSRILVEDERCFHFARCEQFPADKSVVRVGTSLRALSKSVTVCQACLQKLHYKGYDSQKARKEAYSRQVFENFSWNDFATAYHLYPVSEKRELRKKIGGE